VRADGDGLGARELGWPDWPPGNVIDTGRDEPALRVVRMLEEADGHPEWFAVLVVEPVELLESAG